MPKQVPVSLANHLSLAAGLALALAAGSAWAEANHTYEGASDKVRNQAAHDATLPPPTAPLVVAPPLCPGPGCPDFDRVPAPEAQGKRVIYLNWDGATMYYGNENATTNTSRILRFQSRNIPALEKQHLREDSVGSLSLQQIKDIVADNVRFHMREYNVEVVTERPSSGSYHMIVFSPIDDCETIAGANCAGIAPLDCFDNQPSNVVWVFAGGLRVSDLATTSSHEAAHALGVFHTLDTKDIMFPSILNSVPDSFGAGEVPDNDTNCQGSNFQDSHMLLVSTIGVAPEDLSAPSVEITQPASGITIGPGSMIEARVLDSSPIDKVDFYLNGELVRTLTRDQRPWIYHLGPSQPPGPLAIRVVGTDLAGNSAESSVQVEFERGGNMPCTTDEQCMAGFECNGVVCVAASPDGGALGDTCASDDECDSGLCGSVEGESRCTQACDSANACPGGFECIADTACWPADGGAGGGGCSASGDASGSIFGLFGLAGLLALGLRRRRLV